MSAMYRTEVPAYGTLMELVGEVNAETLAADPDLQARLEDDGSRWTASPRSAMAPSGSARLPNCR